MYGRQEAQNRVAGAVDEDVALEHFGDGELGQIGGIEFGRNHQALAAHVDDGAVARGQGAQLSLEVVADFGCVGQQIFFFNVVDDGDGHGAGQRASAKGGAVHAGVEWRARPLPCRAIAPRGMPPASGLASVVTSG